MAALKPIKLSEVAVARALMRVGPSAKNLQKEADAHLGCSTDRDKRRDKTAEHEMEGGKTHMTWGGRGMRGGHRGEAECRG